MVAIRRIFAIVTAAVALAAILGILASCGNSPTITDKLSAAEAAAEVKTLLNDGPGETSEKYFTRTSSTLVAAAAGTYNSKFYDLGKLLVRDGLSHTIIDLGREMNGTWYEWSEHRAPPSEPDAFIRAWRQIVTAMRSVPGQHFKFLWNVFMDSAAVAECWPGSEYVDYIGSDIFDWYGGPKNTYPHTASGALDHENKWQQILTSKPGGLNWMAAFSKATGKPVIIPEWGLDFHTFGGQDDPQFITNMMAWMKAHDAIGLYWGGKPRQPGPGRDRPPAGRPGRSGAEQHPGHGQRDGAAHGRPPAVRGRLPARRRVAVGQRRPSPCWPPGSMRATRLILSVPLVPIPPAIKSYSGPPEPGNQPYQLADYPDAVAALRQGA